MKNDNNENHALNNPFMRPITALARGPKLKAELEASLPKVPDALVRSLPPEERLNLLSQLRLLHIPLNRDVALWELIIDVLLDGYAARTPTTTRVQQELAAVQSFPTKFVYADESDIEASGFAVIGMPTAGKTRSMKRLLRRIPQIVYHEVKENPLLPPLSITWLRVECPANKSLTALAAEIFGAIEKATKEPVPAALKKGNQSMLIQNVATLCAHYKLGMLVIDEIQHVLGTNGKPDLALLNFLVELSNRLNVPLVVVGTPLARKVIGGAMRQARRMLGPEWRNLSRGSTSWAEFSSKLLAYQFTNAVAVTETVEPTLYDLSQGLPGLAVMLWRISQRYAILMEMDSGEAVAVTPEIMTAVYDDHFESVKPMIAALRSGDPQKIALYQDLRMDTESLEEQLANEAAEETETLRMKLFKARQSALAKGKRIIKTALDAQTQALSGAPLPPIEPSNPLLDAFDQAKEDGEDPGAAVAKSA